MNKLTSTFAVATACMAGTAVAGPHDHGVIRINMAIEGEQLVVSLTSPLDSFVGFERAPRTDAEKERAATALKAMRSGELLQPSPEAQCTLKNAQVEAPVLEGKAKPQGGHADLEAEYEFACANPQALGAINLGYFDAFRWTKRVEVQHAGPNGQGQATLRRGRGTEVKF